MGDKSAHPLSEHVSERRILARERGSTCAGNGCLGACCGSGFSPDQALLAKNSLSRPGRAGSGCLKRRFSTKMLGAQHVPRK